MLLFRMKEVDVGGVGQALLVRDGSSFYAVGPKCSHYGAPLEKGKWQTRPQGYKTLVQFQTQNKA